MSACRAKYYMPNAKFLVILRNPTDRAYSEYTYVRNRCRHRHAKYCIWPKIPFYKVTVEGLMALQETPCGFNHGIFTCFYI